MRKELVNKVDAKPSIPSIQLNELIKSDKHKTENISSVYSLEIINFKIPKSKLKIFRVIKLIYDKNIIEINFVDAFKLIISSIRPTRTIKKDEIINLFRKGSISKILTHIKKFK